MLSLCVPWKNLWTTVPSHEHLAFTRAHQHGVTHPLRRNDYILGLEQALRTQPAMTDWNVILAQLPQSIHYQNATILAEDAELYGGLSRLHFSITSRDPRGVAIGQNHLLKVPVNSCPDLAFLLGPAQASVCECRAGEGSCLWNDVCSQGQYHEGVRVLQNRVHPKGQTSLLLGLMGHTGEIDGSNLVGTWSLNLYAEEVSCKQLGKVWTLVGLQGPQNSGKEFLSTDFKEMT